MENEEIPRWRKSFGFEISPSHNWPSWQWSSVGYKRWSIVMEILFPGMGSSLRGKRNRVAGLPSIVIIILASFIMLVFIFVLLLIIINLSIMLSPLIPSPSPSWYFSSSFSSSWTSPPPSINEKGNTKRFASSSAGHLGLRTFSFVSSHSLSISSHRDVLHLVWIKDPMSLSFHPCIDTWNCQSSSWQSVHKTILQHNSVQCILVKKKGAFHCNNCNK